MTATYKTDIHGKEVQYRLMCYNDDSFGNIIETAGSYYNENPNATLLHSDMKIVNYSGALYHFDL